MEGSVAVAVQLRPDGAGTTTWTSANPHGGGTASNQVEMVSFGVDPQWGGLLFSLCSRHEDAGAVLGVGGGGGLLIPSVLSDPLATSSAPSGLASDFVTLTGSGFFDLYSVSSVWAIIVETAKATGMVVLLGVGSLLFYRVYHSIWPRVRRRIRSLRRASARARARAKTPPAPAPATQSSTSGLESDEEASEDEVEGFFTRRPSQHFLNRAPAESTELTSMYFGPSRTAADCGGDSLPLPRSKSIGARRARRKSSHTHSGLQKDAQSLDEEARDADVSEGSRSSRTSPEARVGMSRASGTWWRGAPLRSARAWRGTPCSNTSSSSSRSPEYPPHNRSQGRRDETGAVETRSRRHRPELESARQVPLELGPDPRELILLRRDDSSDSLARRFLTRDESFESLFSYSHGHRRRSLSRNESTDSLVYPPYPARRLPRNESMDSLGFPRRIMTRGSSFDSTCSEMSLDASLMAELEAQGEAAANEANPTLACLEQLQREIDQLKSNCLSLDEEFESVKCNRNLPGMSSLLEVKDNPSGCYDAEERARAERARACFAGLYSLTRITSSPSLDLSDCQLSSLESVGQLTPPHQKQTVPARLSEDCGEEAPVSLEWDEELMLASEETGTGTFEARLAALGALGESMDLGASAATISPKRVTDYDPSERPRPLSLEASCVSLRDSDSMLTSSLATCELDVESELGDCVVAPIPELEHEEPSALGLRLDLVNKSSGGHQPSPIISPDSSWPLCDGTLTRSSSSSGVSVLSRSLSRSLSGLSDAWGASNGSTEATSGHPAPAPAPALAPPPKAIGPRISIHEYASREWQSDTEKANTILRGYNEIPGLLGLHAVRVVRGDNYCSVRGVLFQALSRGLPLPLGRQAAGRCSQLLVLPSGHWLRAWNFAGRLPYTEEYVEDGIRDCLLSLDSTVERLQSVGDRESSLVNLLNSDPWLDARLCEAAKLLMIVSAVELRDAADRGQPLPLFAELLFARDSSSNPRDLMNNHLRHVGDTAGLEQVEMFLLGHSLGIRIRVVRPIAFGSPDYVCSYPDCEDIGLVSADSTGNQNIVDLVAEDDRHYNALVS